MANVRRVLLWAWLTLFPRATLFFKIGQIFGILNPRTKQTALIVLQNVLRSKSALKVLKHAGVYVHVCIIQ